MSPDRHLGIFSDIAPGTDAERAAAIVAAAEQALRDGRTGYPDNQGEPILRQAILWAASTYYHERRHRNSHATRSPFEDGLRAQWRELAVSGLQ